MGSPLVPTFSRSGTSDPGGKLTANLSTLVPEELKEQFTALAVLKSGSVSEYLRYLIEREVHGEFGLMKLRANGRTGNRGIEQE